MATEVKHGPHPTFAAEIRGEFYLTLVGHHTTTADLAAGGIRLHWVPGGHNSFLREPRVIILDEPLTGLDPRGIRNIKQSIRRRAAAGTAFLLSSHLLVLVEALCDKYVSAARRGVVDEALEAGRC